MPHFDFRDALDRWYIRLSVSENVVTAWSIKDGMLNRNLGSVDLPELLKALGVKHPIQVEESREWSYDTLKSLLRKEPAGWTLEEVDHALGIAHSNGKQPSAAYLRGIMSSVRGKSTTDAQRERGNGSMLANSSVNSMSTCSIPMLTEAEKAKCTPCPPSIRAMMDELSKKVKMP